MNPKWIALIVLAVFALVRQTNAFWFDSWVLFKRSDGASGTALDSVTQLALLAALVVFGTFSYLPLHGTLPWLLWLFPLVLYSYRALVLRFLQLLLPPRQLPLDQWAQLLPLSSYVRWQVIWTLFALTLYQTGALNDLGNILVVSAGHLFLLLFFAVKSTGSYTLFKGALRVFAILYLCALEAIPLLLIVKASPLHV